MNDYKVIAKATNDGADISRIITERNEKAARQAFCKLHKDTPHEITGIELVKENTPATKQQERDALMKIRSLVEQLGPNSYIATAFAGCFDIAESNIECDFGDSYKAVAEDLKKKKTELEKKLTAEQEAHQRTRKDLDSATAANANLRLQLNQEQTQKMDPDLYRNIWNLVTADLAETKKHMEAQADTMAECSVNPDGRFFREAVEAYNKNRERRSNREWILEHLKAVAPENIEAGA